MVFIETPRFSKWSEEFLDDDAFSALLQVLEANPSAGKALGHGCASSASACRAGASEAARE